MKYLFISILFVLGLQAYSQNSKVLVDSAEIYFKNTQYDKAINAYNKIIASGEESAALFYNLGNAYYKNNNIPLAIANYERAKRLAPNDEDIIFNLRLAKTQTIDKVSSIPVFFLTDWYNRITGITTTNKWAYISIVSFLLSLSLLLFYFFSRSVQIKKLTFLTASFLLLISLVSMASSYNQKKLNFDRRFAIITTPSVSIKGSPDESSTNLFVLHSGTKLQVLDQIQDWYKIKIENGEIGWIKFNDVEKI